MAKRGKPIIKRNFHVVPKVEGGWAVKRDGATRASSVHKTQAGAIKAAVASAKKSKVEVVTHGRDGRIRDSDSYGNDPRNIRDKKH